MPKPNLPPEPAPIAKVLGGRRRPKPYDVLPTKRKGISLRVEAGSKPNLIKKDLGRLAVAGAEYAARKAELSKLADQQEKPEKKIKQLAQDHEGLRGFQSEADNLKLNVFPKRSIVWNIPELKESLGLAYSAVVSEDLEATVAIPQGYPTKKGPLTTEIIQAAIVRGLVSLGLPEEQLSMIVNSQVVATVNEAKLSELLAAGRATLSEDAYEITETWAITVDPLRKPYTD